MIAMIMIDAMTTAAAMTGIKPLVLLSEHFLIFSVVRMNNLAPAC